MKSLVDADGYLVAGSFNYHKSPTQIPTGSIDAGRRHKTPTFTVTPMKYQINEK